MDKLKILIKYQLSRTFHNSIILIWIAIAVVLLGILLVGVRAEKFPNGIIWHFFGKEVGASYENFYKPFFDFLFYFGVFIFFPIGIMENVSILIDPIYSTYFLAHPISRFKVLFGTLAGIWLSYTIIIISINGLQWFFVWIISGKSIYSLIHQSIFYVMIACSLVTFLVFVSLLSKSVKIGILFYLLYVFLLSNFLTWRSIGTSLLDKILNIIIALISYCLPPAYYINSFWRTSINFHQILNFSLLCMSSMFFLFVISVFIYKQYEF